MLSWSLQSTYRVVAVARVPCASVFWDSWFGLLSPFFVGTPPVRLQFPFRNTSTIGYNNVTPLLHHASSRDVREWLLHSHSLPFSCNQFQFLPIPISSSVTIPVPMQWTEIVWTYWQFMWKKQVYWKLQYQSYADFVSFFQVLLGKSNRKNW